MTRYMTKRSAWKPTGTWKDFTLEGLREVLRRSPQEIQGDKIAKQDRREIEFRLSRVLWGIRPGAPEANERQVEAVRKAFDQVRSL